MFKILAFLSKKPGVTREEFRDYYERSHVPLVCELAPSMRSYRRNFLVYDPAVNRLDDQLDFDVVTEMEFADKCAFESWASAFSAPGAAERIAEDEKRFIDRTRVRICVVEQTD